MVSELQTTPAFSRNRLLFCLSPALVMLLGLASRSPAARQLPAVVRNYSGDILWALLVYLLLGCILPKALPHRIAMCAAIFATSIELSQLFQPDWLEHIRNLPGMRLIFGYSFLWSDLACYATGIASGVFIDIWSAKKHGDPTANA